MEKINNLIITDTAYGGYGVGRSAAGQVIFTPYTVEGDIVDVRIVDDKKQFAYAELLSIIEPSPLRAAPQCGYIDKCGGCLFGHIGYDAQIDIKLKIIKNSFRKYPDAMPDIVTHRSPRHGYRVRATVRARNGDIGFFGFKSRDFAPVENCPVIKSSLFDKLKIFAKNNNITGEIYAIETPDNTAIAKVVSDVAVKDKYPFEGVMSGSDIYGLGELGYTTPYGAIGVGYNSFFQANGYLMDEFQEAAVLLIPERLSVTELYAGSGFFTAGLIGRCDEVVAVEYDHNAVKLAKLYGYDIKQDDAAVFLSKVKKTDCIFLDPPRDGVSNKVISEIKRLKPIKVVYVSCNPLTLARDIIKLSGEYIMDECQFFDNFPDTYHIESVVKLSKK